jgi:tetratricopeptide (TPR) repeat protein
MGPWRRRRGRIGLGLALALVLAWLGAPAAAAPGHAQARARRPREADIVRALAQAERALARGRLVQALSSLEALADRAPEDPRAPQRFCALAAPEDDATVDAYAVEPERVASLARRCARLVAQHARAQPASEALVEVGVWASAVAGDREAWLARVEGRLLDERAIPGLRRLAALAARAGDLDGAARALELARRVRPADPELTAALATVRLAGGDAVGAVPLFRAVAAARPDDPDAVRDLAGALLQAGEPAAAVRALEALVVARPRDPEAWLALARARMELGAFTLAAEAARRAAEVAPPDDARPALALGDALRLEGSPEAASAAYAEALRRDPRSARARAALEALGADEAPAP